MSEVTPFLDGDDLYARGPADSIDLVLDEILGPAENKQRRNLLASATDAGAVGASAAALATTTEQLFRPTAASLTKLRDLGAQLDGNGVMRGYVGSSTLQAPPLGQVEDRRRKSSRRQ